MRDAEATVMKLIELSGAISGLKAENESLLRENKNLQTQNLELTRALATKRIISE